MNKKDEREHQRRLKLIAVVESFRRISIGCIHAGIGRATYYRWKTEQKKCGNIGLIPKSSAPHNPRNRLDIEIEKKVLEVREKFQFGPKRIQLYLALSFPL